MNKIILDKSKKIDLIIDKDSVLNINEYYSIEELNINILDNNKLIINHYKNIENNYNLKLNIKQNNNSEFIFNHSFKNIKNYNLNINIYMNGNNSKNIINIKGLSDRGSTNIVVDGKVNKDTFDNELNEDIKMININEGKSNILPNMYINTKNVLANHACSVTNINEDYLFYLNCKGINNDLAKKMIIDGFIDNIAR